MVSQDGYYILGFLFYPLGHLIVLWTTLNQVTCQDQTILVRESDLLQKFLELIKATMEIAHHISFHDAIASFSDSCIW